MTLMCCFAPMAMHAQVQRCRIADTTIAASELLPQVKAGRGISSARDSAVVQAYRSSNLPLFNQRVMLHADTAGALPLWARLDLAMQALLLGVAPPHAVTIDSVRRAAEGRVFLSVSCARGDREHFIGSYSLLFGEQEGRIFFRTVLANAMRGVQAERLGIVRVYALEEVRADTATLRADLSFADTITAGLQLPRPSTIDVVLLPQTSGLPPSAWDRPMGGSDR